MLKTLSSAPWPTSTRRRSTSHGRGTESRWVSRTSARHSITPIQTLAFACSPTWTSVLSGETFTPAAWDTEDWSRTSPGSGVSTSPLWEHQISWVIQLLPFLDPMRLTFSETSLWRFISVSGSGNKEIKSKIHQELIECWIILLACFFCYVF